MFEIGEVGDGGAGGEEEAEVDDETVRAGEEVGAASGG